MECNRNNQLKSSYYNDCNHNTIEFAIYHKSVTKEDREMIYLNILFKNVSFGNKHDKKRKKRWSKKKKDHPESMLTNSRSFNIPHFKRYFSQFLFIFDMFSLLKYIHICKSNSLQLNTKRLLNC